MTQKLIHSFQRYLRYKNCHRAAKPIVNFARFIKNQLRQLRPKPPGTHEKTDLFHLDNFTIVSGETVSEGLACYGIMEPELTEAFLTLVKPDQTVVDVGMHLGYFTTLFAKLVGPGGKVHAFEPTPTTRDIARNNTAQFTNIIVYPNAIWSHQTKMTFHDYGLAHMAFNSITSARSANNITTIQEHEVEAISLDEFRNRLGSKIDIIKIDAETAEEQILQGARVLLQNDKPILTIEVGDEGEDSDRSRSLIKTLAEMGYQAWEFSEGRFKRHTPRAIYTYDNLIFAPATNLLD